VIGLVVLLVAVGSYGSYREYLASPLCGSVHSADCHDLRQLQVSAVSVQHAKSGDETVVDFAGGNGSATFYADDVSPTSLEVGGLVTAEVWRGTVTAVVIDGRKHTSFGSQADAWIGIVAGAAILLLGLSWLVIDVGVASMDPLIEKSYDKFVSPVKRRQALYVVLPVFGVALAALGLAYIALITGGVATANTLAGIYFVVGLLSLPVLILVFVGWFVRAYLNVGAVGLQIRHSEMFVVAALLVPPLSLYMPYRLMDELVTKTQAPITPATLRSWWLCGLAWLVLTLVGLTVGSPDPTNTTPLNLLSDAMLATSVIMGLIAVSLSVRIIRAVDSTELALWARPKDLR
jgi:uncharacterized protein DUF4328